MRRRELLAAGGVFAAGLAGCAAEPIEGRNESDIEEGREPVDEREEADRTEESGNDSGDVGNETAANETTANETAADGSASEAGSTNDSTDDDFTDDGTNTDETLEADDADNETDADGDADDGTATNEPADANDTDDEPPRGDDPMLDDEDEEGNDTEETTEAEGTDRTEEFDADETFESEEAETLTIGIVGPGGERIEGASVAGERTSDDTTFSGETGDDGTYTVDAPQGIYTIEVDHPAYEGRTVEYAHEDEREIAIELEAGEGTPAVFGLRLVVTDTDGEAIAGANVRGEGAPLDADVPLTFSGETGADGEYVDRIYENEYVIEFGHPDYRDRSIEYDHDGPTELVVELGPAA